VDGDDETAARMAVPGEGLLAAGGLLFLVGLGIVPRLVPTG
jgi:hypothetical protein